MQYQNKPIAEFRNYNALTQEPLSRSGICRFKSIGATSQMITKTMVTVKIMSVVMRNLLAFPLNLELIFHTELLHWL